MARTAGGCGAGSNNWLLPRRRRSSGQKPQILPQIIVRAVAGSIAARATIAVWRARLADVGGHAGWQCGRGEVAGDDVAAGVLPRKLGELGVDLDAHDWHLVGDGFEKGSGAAGRFDYKV